MQYIYLGGGGGVALETMLLNISWSKFQEIRNALASLPSSMGLIPMLLQRKADPGAAGAEQHRRPSVLRPHRPRQPVRTGICTSFCHACTDLGPDKNYGKRLFLQYVNTQFNKCMCATISRPDLLSKVADPHNFNEDPDPAFFTSMRIRIKLLKLHN